MHSSKTCFKCNKTLPLTEFYKHFAMGDGRLGKCKECTRKDVTENRLKNIDRIREYDKNRPNKEERQAAEVVRTRKRRSEDRRYNIAHTSVARAVRKGVLIVEPCQYCGREDKVHAHHDDYDKPLDVMWLCPPCHRKRHDELAKMQKDTF